MKLTFRDAFSSITESVQDEEVADFVVLSGPNGSGKSNLLDAIKFNWIVVDGLSAQGPGTENPEVRLFKLAELIAATESPQTPATYGDPWIGLQELVSQLRQNPPPRRPDPTRVPEGDGLEALVQAELVRTKRLSEAAYQRMTGEIGKRIIDFTAEDYRVTSPVVIQVRDPFSITVGEIFLSYHQRWNHNRFAQFRESTGEAHSASTLTNEQFVERYGPPPWDLLNEILTIVGLNYVFVPPEGSEENLQYEPLLILDEKVLVNTNQLSSGERTLMAIALSIYGGTNLGEAISIPRVLLLDEADASLHPSMIQSLILVATEIFSKQYGSKVIMTTHSPTTVALAPEESIYSMRRSPNPRLRKATRDEALAALTVGIPTLSVRIENRRQVFVESPNDQACYDALCRILRPELQTEFSLEFMGVKFVASRYSIENLVFDPVILGIFLLRERLATPEAMGLPSSTEHFQIADSHTQSICDFVTTQVQRTGDDLSGTSIPYLNGSSVDAPSFYLTMQGHALEQRLVEAFPGMNRWHNPNELKMAVIDRAWKENYQYSPNDVVDLFTRLFTV